MASHDHLVHTHGHDPAGGGEERFLQRGRWVFWIFVIIAASFLISEHRAHVLGALPFLFLFLLACPLLHLFMHGGHGGHGGHGADSAGATQDSRPPAEPPREAKE